MLLSKWQKGRQPRRLLCFSAAFFLSTLLFTLLLGQLEKLRTVILLSGAAVAASCLLLMILLGQQRRMFLVIPLGLLLGWLWCCGYSGFTLIPAQRYDGYAGVLQVELTEYPEGKSSYGTAEGLLTMADGIPCRKKVKLYLQDATPEGSPGDVLTFSGVIYAADRDWRKNLLPQGIMLTVSQEGSITRQQGAAMTLLRRVRIFSHNMAERIWQLLPGDEGALLSALLCGNQSSSNKELQQALTISGTRHVTAVSGLHVSILAGAMILLFGKKPGLLAAVPVIFCYAAIVGFPASVIRAFVLHLFWAAAFWLETGKDSLTALGAGLLGLMVYHPFSCLNAGLLLSFGATLGLILLGKPLLQVWIQPLKKVGWNWLEKILYYIASTFSSSLAATLFTLPLNLLFFETVPMLSLLSNVLILWAVALAMELGIGMLLLSLISMPVAGFFAKWVVRWPLWWMVTVVKKIGSLRFAATDGANFFLAVFSGVILVILFLWKGQKLSGKYTLAAAALLLSGTVLLTAAERMTFGQVQIVSSGGQAALLIRGDGVCAVNTGARPDIAGEALENAMIRWNADRAQLVLCTSENYKTQGGLPAVLEQAQPASLLLPSSTGTISEEFAEYSPQYFDRSGAVKCGDFVAELLDVGEGSYLCRLLGEHSSFLLASGIKKDAVLEAVEQYDCRASVLILDSAQAQDFQTRYRLYAAAQPKQIYCIASGYDGQVPASCCGIPIQMVDMDGATVHYMR